MASFSAIHLHRAAAKDPGYSLDDTNHPLVCSCGYYYYCLMHTLMHTLIYSLSPCVLIEMIEISNVCIPLSDLHSVLSRKIAIIHGY